MTERTKTGLNILKAAAVIGVFGNIMLRQTPWGVNAFLFVMAFVGALFLLTKMRRPELLTVNRLSLMGAMAFFASMFVFRDSIELRVYDTIAILIIMGVLMLGTFGINARTAGVFHYAAGFIWAGLNSVLGSFVVLGADLDWKSMPGSRLSRNIFAVLRGAAIALPLLLIFGALFSSADARFEALANQVISFDLENVISHIAITAVLAWLSAGYFRGSIITPGFVAPAADDNAKTSPTPESDETTNSYFDRAAAEPAEAGISLPDSATVLEHINRSDPPNADSKSSPPYEGGVAAASADGVVLSAERKKRDWQNIDSSSFPGVFTLGVTETVIILGLLDALFLTFVIIQAPYLFGGMELVQNTPDFKLADYARRGFGELVAVAALVLPVLLLSHWLLRRQENRLETVFRVLAGIQVALVFVIMASAVQRLVLLTGVEGYGLTTVRFYPMVFMLWLAVVFAWFGATVLRNARQNFAWGALWSAIVILAATNLMNPDAFIARTNIELMKQGRDFDAHYNSQLSSDAVPELISALPAMQLEDQCRVKWELQKRYRELEENYDVRSLNLSRRNFFHLLNDNGLHLDSMEDCPPNSVKEVIKPEETD